MESRSINLLEFHKILKALSGFAKSETGAFVCNNLLPGKSLEEIRRQGRLYSQGREWLSATGYSLPPFISLEGLFSYLEKLNAVLDTDALFALRTIFEIATTLRKSLSDYEDRGWAELGLVFFEYTWPQKAASGITRCLDQDGRLKDDSSPDLYAVRQEIRSIHTRCTKNVKDYVLREGIGNYLQEDFMTISSDRYVLPLKVNFKNKLNGIIHDYSQTGETCYFEPMFLVETNNRLQELKREEREEEHKVLKYLTEIVRQEFDGIEACYQSVVEADVLQAKLAFGTQVDGRIIDVETDTAAHLTEAKHPLLAVQESGIQSIDIEFLPDTRALIVSGGNAGGKTVCLKTLGLCALMAYAGIPAPVGPGSRLPFWKSIFVIMGDEQSLEENVSTFTAQIHYLQRNWPNVDKDTLFILDEFGAGTDPTQGAALAQAVVDELMARKATTITATHFPALKAYAMATQGVRAASVLFDPTTKRPLYRLAYDQVGASIALDVARDNGLPPEILDRAEKYLLLDGSDTSAVLDRLNDLAVKREKELDKAKARQEQLEKKYSRMEQEFARNKEKLLKEVQSQARQIVQEWKSDRISRKQAQKKLAAVREELNGTETKAQKRDSAFSWEDIHVGMEVMYSTWNKTGTVQELNDRKKQAKVDINGVSMWVRAEHLGPGKKQAQQSGHTIASVSREPVSLEVDLRGLRSDEAIASLERFLDGALLRGADRIEIIHGRGTGALRREVHDFLKHYPAADSYSLASEEHGGDGMTEVTLK